MIQRGRHLSKLQDVSEANFCYIFWILLIIYQNYKLMFSLSQKIVQTQVKGNKSILKLLEVSKRSFPPGVYSFVYKMVCCALVV